MVQYQVTAVVVVVIIVAILAQLELDSEPLVAKRAVALTAGKEEAFRMITDLKKFPKWMSLVEELTENPEYTSREKVGKPFRLYVKTPFTTAELAAKITKHLPVSLFEFEAKSSLVTARVLFELEHGDRDGFSRLTVRMYAKRKSYLYLMTVVQPLKFILSDHVTASLFNLKVLLQ